ncbi:iron(III) transport system ATP-binding protein [Loktanella fryxellensis]|uniref:Iron(III) transport system ATP-binding protein n=1 Tax=Loktanella fryxellensis TaxID=245187 RepID=A0A1H8B398_9RHOB|nr:hypothetical protein [Loktanella fryxellensis]SEM77402.1 iron(III) transport system ATP-binding protein [Loktanella fryxellensis]
MIAPRPRVLLFNEPLSNLDTTLRVERRTELLRVHRATGAAAIYVTHDQIEAMMMATHVAVMNGGRIEQFDTPDRLLSDPASAFVARFIGTPPANLIPVVRCAARCGPARVHGSRHGAGRGCEDQRRVLTPQCRRDPD